ncbi:hypothetical protein I4U23_001911 [Adineta vaga]|nr:hypothetical protein I4U23_001911 [Adineta vaga]
MFGQPRRARMPYVRRARPPYGPRRPVAYARQPRIPYALRPNVVYPPSAPSISPKAKIICICITAFLILAAIGIALGVGLGVGLNKSDSSSDSSTSTPCPTCGCSSVSITSSLARIVNGNTATPHSWPWIVAIYKDDSFICGGSLISYKHVLTAAHCLYETSSSSLTIYAGLQTLSDRSTGQSRTVSSMWIHPSYTSSTFDYDIGVIKLSSDFTGSGTVSLACLPPANNSIPSNNEKGMAIGWGKTSGSATITESSTLQQVVLQVQNTSPTCDLSVGNEQQFCAGFGETATCNGDSGGPLMTSVNGAWTVTGVVNYGQTSCDGSSVFARVAYFRSLIDSQLQSL